MDKEKHCIKTEPEFITDDNIEIYEDNAKHELAVQEGSLTFKEDVIKGERGRSEESETWITNESQSERSIIAEDTQELVGATSCQEMKTSCWQDKHAMSDMEDSERVVASISSDLVKVESPPRHQSPSCSNNQSLFCDYKRVYTCSGCDELFGSLDALSTHTERHCKTRVDGTRSEEEECVPSGIDGTRSKGEEREPSRIDGTKSEEEASEYVPSGPSSGLETTDGMRTGVKPYICVKCGKSFTTSKSLTRHQRIHTGIKPFMCDECGKSFLQPEYLKIHKRIHTGVKPYICDDCGKSFTAKGSLNIHKRTHTGIKPFMCEECGKSFNQAFALKIHKRIHTGVRMSHTCDECGKSFTTPQSLKRHVYTHTGERPFVCEECGKAFAEHSKLTIHRRIHTGEKPYVCQECGRVFARYNELGRHQRTHTDV